MKLFTFGYEGLAIDQFVSRLIASGISEVIDVRELPLSRKRGFSKRAFAGALEEAGIEYTHWREFGCPKQIRNRYRADADWAAYVKAYRVYLSEQQVAVDQLAEHSRKTMACLVCFEADFSRCHRSLVAQASRRAGGAPVHHLTIRGVIPDVERWAA